MKGGNDNCSGSITYSFSSDPSNTTLLFGCANLGINSIVIWGHISGEPAFPFLNAEVELMDSKEACSNNLSCFPVLFLQK